ncbi:ATP synthase F1 subunit delta [Cesiribacter andamanensis]|uniref:ATP synthase subunit delta n=1 Tax=Cesiribacter andamanensis AMV16 TaxID=1279009 RepID=M7N3N2_9BACT|nr:ATP synthase F1 subunit delta [Cesiribacter andamanensis]EMR01816.1 F-type ATPase subunit delta [Cesiribacter andamanensis AMV16]
MAAESRVASRYAKSLLDLAVERGELEAVQQDMQLLHTTIRQNRQFELLLTNPIIRSDKKKAVLTALFRGKISLMTGKFLEIISNKNREDVLPGIAAEFLRQYRSYKGITRAQVITTFPLSPELRSRFMAIVAEITGNQVELEEKIDKDLIGGYVLRIGDRQIDESLKSKLEELEAEFSKNPYEKAF